MTTAERECYETINFEETELRLGLPGGTKDVHSEAMMISWMIKSGKRGFAETEDDVDLKLNLSSTATGGAAATTVANNEVKTDVDEKMKEKAAVDMSKQPPAKAQVVGWPPVRSFRKNIMAVQKPNKDAPPRPPTTTKKKEVGEITTAEKVPPAATTSNAAAASSAAFVKVSMDGAPYLRKVDLKLYKSYQELSDALTHMFSSFTNGKDPLPGDNNKMANLLNSSDYVPTYEDKDGDWMLVGDVPWEMFVDSCKRLRIMKGSEAVGLSPRAVLREKCKTRS